MACYLLVCGLVGLAEQQPTPIAAAAHMLSDPPAYGRLVTPKGFIIRRKNSIFILGLPHYEYNTVTQIVL